MTDRARDKLLLAIAEAIRLMSGSGPFSEDRATGRVKLEEAIKEARLDA